MYVIVAHCHLFIKQVIFSRRKRVFYNVSRVYKNRFYHLYFWNSYGSNFCLCHQILQLYSFFDWMQWESSIVGSLHLFFIFLIFTASTLPWPWKWLYNQSWKEEEWKYILFAVKRLINFYFLDIILHINTRKCSDRQKHYLMRFGWFYAFQKMQITELPNNLY